MLRGYGTPAQRVLSPHTPPEPAVPQPAGDPQPMNRNSPRLFLLASMLLAFVVPAFAQATGTITGHVYNLVSKEYVRDAEVRVEGTDISAVSGTSGTYTLARVPV